MANEERLLAPLTESQRAQLEELLTSWLADLEPRG
jgi:hypothetical protein